MRYLFSLLIVINLGMQVAIGQDQADEDLLTQARQFRQQRKHNLAADAAKEILVVLEKTGNKDGALEAAQLAAQCYKSERRYEDAGVMFTKALELMVDLKGEDSLEVMEQIKTCIYVYYKLGNFEQADGMCKRWLETAEKYHRDNIELYAECLNKGASLYETFGKFEPAADLREKRLNLEMDYFGSKDDPRLKLSVGKLAKAYLLLEKYDKAERLYYQHMMIAVKEDGGKEDSYGVVQGLEGLVSVYMGKKEFKKAEEAGVKLIEIMETFHGKNNPLLEQNLLLIGDIYTATGEFQKAEGLYERALKCIGIENFRITRSVNKLAELYIKQKRYQDAEKMYLRSYEVIKGMMNTNSQMVIPTLDGLGDLYTAMGEYKKAEKWYMDTVKHIENMRHNNAKFLLPALTTLKEFYELTENNEKVIEINERLKALNGTE